MNKVIPSLKSARPVEDYKLFVEFDDGVNGIIDLSSWKGKGVFSIWNDEKNFKSFKITDKRKLSGIMK